MKYELWKHEDEFGVAWAFIPIDDQYDAFHKFKEYEPASEMGWNVEAETKDDAIARYSLAAKVYRS